MFKSNKEERDAFLVVAKWVTDDMTEIFIGTRTDLYKEARMVLSDFIRRTCVPMSQRDMDHLIDELTNFDLKGKNEHLMANGVERHFNELYITWLNERPSFIYTPIKLANNTLTPLFDYSDVSIIHTKYIKTISDKKSTHKYYLRVKANNSTLPLDEHVDFASSVAIGLIRAYITMKGDPSCSIMPAEEEQNSHYYSHHFKEGSDGIIREFNERIRYLSCWETVWPYIEKYSRLPTEAVLDFNNKFSALENSRNAFYLFNCAASDKNLPRAIVLLVSSLESMANGRLDRSQIQSSLISFILDEIIKNDPADFFVEIDCVKCILKEMYSLRSDVTHGKFTTNTLHSLKVNERLFKMTVAKILIYHSHHAFSIQAPAK
jgi:hypothetical protein